MIKVLQKTIFSLFVVLILFSCTVAFAKSKKEEKIPASVRVQVEYEQMKNRESYRQDILRVLENYLLESGCFERIMIGEQNAPDLILEARIVELEMMRDYGASLGDVSSEYSDPDTKTNLVVSCILRMQLFIIAPGSKDPLYATRIEVDESRKKMYPTEDTEKHAWEALLAGVEREAQKRICGKKEKIIEALMKK